VPVTGANSEAHCAVTRDLTDEVKRKTNDKTGRARKSDADIAAGALSMT
jgi:hypothetical protein